jgi:hypothetical protein
VSSRTLHIAWDEAGCLCPVGDLFNDAALDDTSFEEDDIAGAERLTDGGYEDSNAYCLYARKNYKKGEQVCFYFFCQYNIILLLFFFLSLFFLYTYVLLMSLFFVHLCLELMFLPCCLFLLLAGNRVQLK